MCKVLCIVTYLSIIYLRSITGIKCPSCDDIFVDVNNASLPDSEPYCKETLESTSVCRSELYVDLIDTYPAMIKYITAPSNDIITSNGDSEMITTIKIPLDVEMSSGSIIYNCYDTDLCNNRIVQKQYAQLRTLNSTKLMTELTGLLYNDQNILQQYQIECYHRNNQIEKCAINGSCQATLIIEQGRSDSLITTCIPNRRPGSVAGLILRSKSIGNDYKKTSITYTCNKNKCNDPVIVQKVRQLFVEVDLVHSKANNLKFLSIVLFIICIITNIWIH
jgi:hypothetical protein